VQNKRLNSYRLAGQLKAKNSHTEEKEEEEQEEKRKKEEGN